MLTGRVLRVLPAQETNIFCAAGRARCSWAAKKCVRGVDFIDERILLSERAACSTVRMSLFDGASCACLVRVLCPVIKFCICVIRFACDQIFMIGNRFHVSSSYMTCMVHVVYLVGFKENHVSERFARA